MKNKLAKQLIELEEEQKTVASTRVTRNTEFGSYENIDDNAFRKWKVKVKNVIVKICGENSEQYKELTKAEKPNAYTDSWTIFNAVNAVFQATKEDFEGGYLSSYKTMVQAEIFDTELEQAKELLKSGYYSAAAVISGVVLETTLRELCDRESLEHGKMDKMNADLAKAGIYNKIVQKQITTYAAIRNSAAHGKQEGFNKTDVEQMIPGIEHFLATHLDS